jgi:hypothetical protein
MRVLRGVLVLGGSTVEEENVASMGWSEVRERIVSAATMPPMEWPMRITWTEGSIVGEGVWEVTSMSITFSCSLF